MTIFNNDNRKKIKLAKVNLHDINMQTLTKNVLPFAQLPQGHFISMSLDYAGNVLVLTTKNEPDFRNGCFSKIIPKKPQTYQIWSTADAWSGEFYPYAEITASTNFHEVQRFANGDILLVCGRCQYRPNGKSDKNGFIYSADGQLKSQFLLGDGIESTQISKQGTIWTSYFDEGIFGNYGWNFGQTIGKSGLVAWTANGKKNYEFQPIAGLDNIFDCYAMNLVSDNLTY